MDAVPVEKYLLSENDLAAYTANLYNSLPSHKPGVYDIGVFATDNNSDNQAASNPEKLFVKGENRVAQSGGAWNFSEIRSANYFINRVRPLLEAGELGAMKPTTNIIWVKPISSVHSIMPTSWTHWATSPLSRQPLPTIMKQ